MELKKEDSVCRVGGNIWVRTMFLVLGMMACNFKSSATRVPYIDVYQKVDYRAGQANRGFAQDQTGNLYIANSEGMLRFDGLNFDLFPIDNKTQVLSIAINRGDSIFVGGQGDFGYFLPDKKGALKYTSLKGAVPEEEKNFSDIRAIRLSDNGVYFKSLLRVFYWDYSTGKIKAFKSGASIDQIFYLGRNFFICDREKGIISTEGEELISPEGGTFFKNKEVSAIVKWQNGLLVSTWKEGLFHWVGGEVNPFKTEVDSQLKREFIKVAVEDKNGRIVLGTVSGGVYIIDENGQVKLHVNKDKGLKSNSIQDLYFDQFENLWVGLENGINYVKIGEPFRAIYPNPGQELIGYAARIFNDRLYLATNLGLYCTEATEKDELSDGEFELVPGSEGLCWNLSQVDDELFLHHHEGFFKILDKGLLPIRKGAGSWIVRPLNGVENNLIEGTYFGVNVFGDKPDSILFPFKESARFIEQDGDYIWVSHDYKGVFRLPGKSLDFEGEVVHFNGENGFPSDIDINVFSINGQMVFTTEKGIFKYDKSQGKIVPDDVLNELFGTDANLKRLIQDDFGRLWFVDRKRVGFVDLNAFLTSGQIKKKYLPELEGRLAEHFQHIYPFSKEMVLFGTENSFIEYRVGAKSEGRPSFNTVIHQISISPSLDSIIYNGLSTPFGEKGKQGVAIQYAQNSIRFKYASNYFSDLKNITFSTKLDGYEENWSDDSFEAMRTFTNLPYGDYTFFVRSKNAEGELSEPISFSFEILAPWYSTNWAKALFGFLAVFCLFLLWQIPRIRHQQQTRRLKEVQRQKLEDKEKIFTEKVKESEEKVMRLRNEKLKDEVSFKNQELASSTMHLVQKTEMLSKIKDELLKIQKSKQNNEIKDQIGKVIRKIDQDLRLDENWNHFEKYFDQVHTDFIQNLREQYPQLTTKDYKLCVFLRMNLSSKEIATLLNITTRSVEVSRYRLRKKLNIDTQVNLTDFIMDIG